MSADQDGDLEKLRAIALALPGAQEHLSNGQPAFRVEGGDVFAYLRTNSQAEGGSSVVVKTAGPDEATSLIDADPALYFTPLEFAGAGWIAIRTDAPAVDWDRIGDRVAQSWEMVAPRRYLEAGGR